MILTPYATVFNNSVTISYDISSVMLCVYRYERFLTLSASYNNLKSRAPSLAFR